MESLKRIIILASHQPNLILEEVASRNARILANNGILYPDCLDIKVKFSDLWAHGDIFRAVTSVETACSLEAYAQKICAQISVSNSKIRTLLLAVGGVGLKAEAMGAIQRALNSFFKKIPISFFIVCNRQDIAIENSIAWSSLHGHMTDNNQQTNPTDYKQAIELLYQSVNRDNVTIYFLEDTAEDTENVQKAMLRDLGFNDSNMASCDIGVNSSRYTLRLPPPLLAFCATACSLDRGNHFRDFWLEEASRYVNRCGYSGEQSVLLDYERRVKVLRLVEESNADLAASLGRPYLFRPAEPDGRSRFTGLTEYMAFAVAEYLDPDFARNRMAEFDAASVQFLTREQRVCRQALHDVLDPPSHAPLIRPGRVPKVSVCTLAYNHAPYIGECIESVIAQQTDFPVQHIIADDCSDDGTQDIVLDYAAKYPHIVPIFQRKRSFGPKNIRAMFDLARTEYVALCDGDDYFTDPYKLQAQADLLDAHPDFALCFHEVRVVFEGAPERERIYPPEEVLPRGVRPFYYLVDLLRNNFIQTNAVMYRWRFRNGLPDWFRTDLTPGDRYWHLLHAEIGKIGFIKTVMSAYRRHEKSVFYLSEVDKLKHRAKVGIKEIEVYDVINRHFNRKYEPILVDLILHVFADCLLYDVRQEEEGVIGEHTLQKLSDKYPDFARHFLASLDPPLH